MNLKSLIVKMARRASNKAYELQPEQTNALVLGFAKFLFGHGSCRKKARTTLSQKLLICWNVM